MCFYDCHMTMLSLLQSRTRATWSLLRSRKRDTSSRRSAATCSYSTTSGSRSTSRPMSGSNRSTKRSKYDTFHTPGILKKKKRKSIRWYESYKHKFLMFSVSKMGSNKTLLFDVKVIISVALYLYKIHE